MSYYINLDLTGLQLNDIIWGAIRRLMEIGIHIICLVCDGGKPNRKFLHNHFTKEGTRNGIAYKVRNMYDPQKFIYFMSDVPHLIKTTRNCWANSSSKGTRYMWVSQMDSIIKNKNYYICSYK